MEKSLNELENEYAGRKDELLEYLYGCIVAREKLLVETENVLMSIVTAQKKFNSKNNDLHNKAYELEYTITNITGDFGTSDIDSDDENNQEGSKSNIVIGEHIPTSKPSIDEI